MRIIQIILNHCRFAQDLPEVKIAIISEAYRNHHGGVWVTDSTGGAAIWTCGQQAIHCLGVRHTAVTPSLILFEFEEILDSLVLDARGRNPMVIAGHFNAWARELGTRETNSSAAVYLTLLHSWI